MKTKRQLIITIAACITIGSLAGCAGSQSYETEEEAPPAPTVEHYYDDDIFEIQKTLEDGRTITCILYERVKEAGISCDWNPPAQ